MRHPSQALDRPTLGEYNACSPNGAVTSVGNPKLITSTANDSETERFRRAGPFGGAGGGGFGRGGFRRRGRRRFRRGARRPVSADPGFGRGRFRRGAAYSARVAKAIVLSE